ncbi:hypothetical protein [Absidia glauca]|uniref:Ndc10 domain-containing protein n=1 Tax=Absidia glauca TaxID=4829 RepID=A0A163MQG1_ABSGL|nr:hypothetical protein [Absidia glauca]
MEHHKDERRISYHPSKRNDMTNDRLSHQWSILYPTRASLDPPSSLCKKLFPAIDERHDRLAANELSPDNNNPIQTTAVANAFVQVVIMLRKSSIQDSVLVMELHPCHPIWQHSTFSDPVHLSFKRDLLQN